MTILGFVQQINSNALHTYVQFTPLDQPTMVGSSVVGSKFLTVESDEETGAFEVDLDIGDYRVTVDGVNLIISVPTTSGTANIDTLVTGVVTMSPVYSTTGWITAQDVATLRLIHSSTSLQFARLTNPAAREPREWYYVVDSTSDDDGLTIVKPYDLDASEPGRWLVWS